MSGKLFVGGLSWETTEEKLKSVYQEFGEVSEVQIMRDRISGKARGFGFVTYTDPEVANKVSGQKYTIDGREVETKLSLPRDQIAPGSHLPVVRQDPPCIKIFVGGIGGLSTEQSLTDYFSKYGEVQEFTLMKDRNTGVSRGFGFCTFAQPESAAVALKESRSHEIDNKTVEIKPAESREECNMRKGGGKGGFDGMSGGPMRGGYIHESMRAPMYGGAQYSYNQNQGFSGYQSQPDYGASAMNFGQVPGYMQYMEQGQQQIGYSHMPTPETWNAGYGGAAEQIPPPPEVPPPPPTSNGYQPANGAWQQQAMAQASEMIPPPPGQYGQQYGDQDRSHRDRAHPYAR